MENLELSSNCGFDVISLGLTISSILIGAASFLLGFYLTERGRGVPKARLAMFKYLLLSLIVPVFIIMISAVYFVIPELAESTISVFLFVSIIVSLVPAIALLVVVIKKW